MADKLRFCPPVPMMQIRSKCVILFDLWEYRAKGNNLISTYSTYTGKTTTGAARRIRKAVDLLIQFSPPRMAYNPATGRRFKHTLSFITLTIPGKEKKVNTKYSNKNLLEPWLRIMRKKQSLRTYIWKAEFQKNGQLHYHVTTPAIIHHSFIKDTWNNILSGAGLLTQWLKEHSNTFPNSTDVHEVYRSPKLQSYLSKEISKNQQDNQADSKIWDCSKNIKQTKFYSVVQHSDLYKFLNPDHMTHLERCSIYEHHAILARLPPKDANNYNAWRSAIIQNTIL